MPLRYADVTMLRRCYAASFAIADAAMIISPRVMLTLLLRAAHASRHATRYFAAAATAYGY